MTTSPAIAMLKQTRTLIVGAVSGLSPDQWLKIPSGFDNNIAWNVGHIIAVQQSLLYLLSGNDLLISREMLDMYRPNTSPADWTKSPDIGELQTLFIEHPNQLELDYAAGKFTNFRAYTTTTKVLIDSFTDSLIFNSYHEGLHFGTILSIRNFVN